MRWIIACSFALISTGSFAFDGVGVSKQYSEAREQCRQAETSAGVELSAEESDKQCKILAKLGRELKANKWCWDKSEVSWYPCQFASYVDYANHQ